MRKFKFTLIAFMAAMMALSFTACSDDDPEPNPCLLYTSDAADEL